MGTIIRINPKRWRFAILLGAAALVQPAAYGAEPEIHVSTGPDGIEIYSNLPRGSVALKKAEASPAKGAAILMVAQSFTAPDISGGQGSDMDVPGKSFLQDD